MDFLKANVTLNSEDIGKLIENEDIYIADVDFNQNLQVISIKILTQNGIGRLEYIPEKKEWSSVRNQKLIESEVIRIEPKLSNDKTFYDDKTGLTGITADKIIPNEKSYVGKSLEIGDMKVKDGVFHYSVKASDYISGINKGEGKVYIKNTDKEEELEKRVEMLEEIISVLDKELEEKEGEISYLDTLLSNLANTVLQLEGEINTISHQNTDLNEKIVSLNNQKEDKVAVEYIANHIIPQISFVMHQELDKMRDTLNLKKDKSEYTNTTGNDYLSKLEDKLETKLTANKLKNNALEDKLINQLHNENTEEELNKHVEEMTETTKKAGEIIGESSDILLKSLDKVLSQYSDIISVNRVEDDEK